MSWFNQSYRHYLAAKRVKTVNWNRYAGRWYEQASFPTWFQSSCKNKPTAEYTKQPDGKLKVVNRCGKSSVTGTAEVSGKNSLKVSFFPFIKGDYVVEYTDYSSSIVGHPQKKYLWILSRQKRIPMQRLDELKRIAERKGYDVGRLR